jgi:hypothetical protein
VDVVEKPKFFEGDRLVSGCPSGSGESQQKIYIAISMTYVFAVLFGLARHRTPEDATAAAAPHPLANPRQSASRNAAGCFP